ncbi:MAG TPA: DUF6599 family protein [Candidatus Methylomirabilis sp.]|nr:DUF6599 family protein [Candidatus Methylomirabilis sp.]HSB81878.1 DUF6599 family protein [Candidatus Methylomirabilis sp.]
MNRPMVPVLAIWLCVAAGIASADAANRQEAVVLPAAVDGWIWDGQEAHYDARTVFDYIDGAGELFLAYGFERLAVRRFEKAGQPPLTVECYRMASAEAAFGVFSFERQGEGIGIGQGSEQGGGLLRFWKGRYFVSIFADGEGAEAESAILHLARLTAAAIREEGQAPRAIGLIPGKDAGLVETSVRYVTSHILLNQRLFIARDNVLGLTRETGAVLARYGRDAAAAHLLVVRYPTATAAGAAYGRFMAAYLSAAAGKDRVQTTDGRWTIARQRQADLTVVIGAPSETIGEALLAATEKARRTAQ